MTTFVLLHLQFKLKIKILKILVIQKLFYHQLAYTFKL